MAGRAKAAILAAAGMALCAPAAGSAALPADVDLPLSYKLLESLQIKACRGHGSDACSFDDGECVSMMADGWPALFHEQPPGDLIRRMCSGRRTKAEIPGGYFLLHNMLDEIGAVLPELGYDAEVKTALGTLAGPEVNAIFRSSSEDRVRIIILNQALLNLAYAVPKVASTSVPITNEAGHLSMDLSDEALIHTLQSDPELIQRFLGVLMTIAGIYFEELPPPEESRRPLILALTEGAETFALAHEVSHLLLGHNPVGSQTLSAAYCLGDQDSDVVQSTNSWLNEIEADILAMKIIRLISARKAKNADENIFIRNTFQQGAAYYFLISEMHDRLRANLSGSGGDDGPTRDELLAARLIVDCADEEKCDLRAKLAAAVPSVLELAVHPHPQIRRQIAEAMTRKLLPSEEGEQMLKISRIMYRNTVGIWTMIEPKLPRLYEAGIRLPACSKGSLP
jgi:hypothetical protein